MPRCNNTCSGQLAAQKPIVIALEVYAMRNAPPWPTGGDCLTEITGLFIRSRWRHCGYLPQALSAGHAQIAFLDTLSIIYGQAKYGFDTGLVILRTYQDQLAPFSQRQFIANTASGARTISDLYGKTFCFGEPNSPYGTGIPRIVLAANGINPDKDLKAIKYTGSAENIASAVYKGECDGYHLCGCPDVSRRGTRQDLPGPSGEGPSLYVTDKIPNDGVQYIKNLTRKSSKPRPTPSSRWQRTTPASSRLWCTSTRLKGS
jgi:hypothetical protein